VYSHGILVLKEDRASGSHHRQCDLWLRSPFSAMAIQVQIYRERKLQKNRPCVERHDPRPFGTLLLCIHLNGLRFLWALGTFFPGDTKQVLVLATLGALLPGDNQTTQTHTWKQNPNKPNVRPENTVVPESNAWILRSTSLRLRIRRGLHPDMLNLHFENTAVLGPGQSHCLCHPPHL